MRGWTGTALTVAAATLLLAGCSYRPTIRTPTLPKLAPIEATMSCPQIDLAIDRADTVRWVIRDDGGSLETSSERSARYAGNVVLVPLSLLGGVPVAMGDGGHALLTAADRRIRQLLQLKRERGCPARPTTFPQLDDLAMLRELELLQARLDAGQGDQAAVFAERTRLLDGLRVVPSPPPQAPRADPAGT